MRNWLKTVPNASFRGSRFFVEEERLAGGREVAIHRFVKSEDHATEDMGRKPLDLSIAAYITGDRADTDAVAFVEVCSTAGAGTLVMPILGTHTVRCIEVNASSLNTAKLGFVKIDLKFVEAGNDSAFSTIAIGDRIASNLMGGMASVINTAIAAFAG